MDRSIPEMDWKCFGCGSGNGTVNILALCHLGNWTDTGNKLENGLEVCWMWFRKWDRKITGCVGCGSKTLG